MSRQKENGRTSSSPRRVPLAGGRSRASCGPAGVGGSTTVALVAAERSTQGHKLNDVNVLSTRRPNGDTTPPRSLMHSGLSPSGPAFPSSPNIPSSRSLSLSLPLSLSLSLSQSICTNQRGIHTTKQRPLVVLAHSLIPPIPPPDSPLTPMPLILAPS